MKHSRALLIRSITTACAAVAFGAVSSSGLAATGGATLTSGGLSGSYNYTTGAGTLSLTLTNLVTNPTSTAQLLSDVSFSLSSGSLGSGSITGTGNLVTCTDNTSNCVSSAGPANPWFFGANNSGVGTGDSLLTALQGNTRSLIIGTTDPGYCLQPGGSLGHKCPDGIGGNINQPYFQNSATFSFTGLTGVTSATTLQHVALSFGTGPETVVPIPAALWLFGSGLVGLIGIARRRIAGATPMPA
jgi:hypothetical protein